MYNSMSYGKPKTLSSSDMILNRLNQRKVNIQETSINSAALQDHIISSFNLGDLDPFKRKPISYSRPAYMNKYSAPKPPTGGRALSNAGATIIRTESASSNLTGNGRSESGKRQSTSRKPTFKKSIEESKVAKKGSNVYQTKNLIEKLNTETYINIEKKREDYVNKLTLAQRRGLVPKPSMPLSQNEWKNIETKGATRAETNDFCSI